MARIRTKKAIACAALMGLVAPVLLVGTAGAAGKTRTSGTGQSLDVGWTEYDPGDLLGLPGNVHIGYLYAYAGPWGDFVGGSVSDFDCDEGETPWGGGHGFVAGVVDEGASVVSTAAEDAIDDAIDSGAASIDGAVVLDSIQSDLSTEIPELIAEEYEQFPKCEYMGDRFLSGDGTTTVSINATTKVATIKGDLTVSNGGHGEPGIVLATPPVDIKITGGDWNQFEWSYSSKGAGYSYSDWQKGTYFYGGIVTGGIGRMGFADDADDVSYGGFGSYKFKTVERIR